MLLASYSDHGKRTICQGIYWNKILAKLSLKDVMYWVSFRVTSQSHLFDKNSLRISA